jgi:hypothetical protein
MLFAAIEPGFAGGSFDIAAIFTTRKIPRFARLCEKLFRRPSAALRANG